jgi:predicted dienelactone hydrolase
LTKLPSITRQAPLGILALGCAIAAGASGPSAPSVPSIDAPELARLGGFDVGVKTIALVQSAQHDVLAFDPASGTAPLRDRRLQLDLWYPAQVPPGAERETYSGALTAEPPAPPTSFTITGIAVRDAPPAAGSFPLVIVSHGYDNESVAMSWLTENLASKGYVVAAIRHRDPPITDGDRIAEPLLRRPLDIAYVARSLRGALAGENHIDPARVALVGYSMGGYGVLTAAGAELDPDSPMAGLIPGGLLTPYARGGALRDSLRVGGIRAVIALAPGGGSLRAWGTQGLQSITVPTLMISGDRDFTVDYQSGARSFFDLATNCERYLLTFKGAGHRVGLGPAPAGMRDRLWDFDWFEDPVWRQDRIVGINLHFITAFLDRYVKDDAGRAAYLDGLVPESAQAAWPASAGLPYGAYSPGNGDITVWKGFQRRHAEGLQLLHAAPARPAASAP